MGIDYEELLEEALFGVVKKALAQVAQEGFANDHHFYISLDTTYPGVILSSIIKARYPEEITIVLQNQFENLQVFEDAFTVRLTFNNIPETIRVPFKAIINFVDPGTNFILPLATKNRNNLTVRNKKNTSNVKIKSNPDSREVEKTCDNVISLEKFRNKNKID